MWSAIGVAASFLVIIVLVTRKVALGYALLAGSFVAAISSGLSPWGFLTLSAKTLVQPGTLNLVSTLVLISILGSWMKNLGILDRMVDALEKVLRSAKLTITVIPSIMGTLLVTGGAIMAAPMVNSIGERINLSNKRRAAINLLYRHAWYFIFPFAPAFILVKEIANVEINRLILIQFPLTVVAVWSGYQAWLKDVQEDNGAAPKPTRDDYLDLLRYTSPLWSALVLGLGFGLPFQLALLVGLGLALYFGRPQLNQIPMMILKGIQVPIVLSGVGIMIFKDVLTSGDTLSTLTSGLLNLGLPLWLIVLVLPALVSFVSASSTSGIGITLPLLLPAIQQSEHLLLYVAGVYTASFLGYYSSPLHLCQVLTLEFFQVKMNDLYREYILPVSAMWLTLFAIMAIGHLV
ncbi:MAG TPA: DUF401 family protein [Firmicutes bacterium]|jgi:integral membrane protein (TIGR00529 family)|nr:DUF401 family protein [Bacillota bacterium]